MSRIVSLYGFASCLVLNLVVSALAEAPKGSSEDVIARLNQAAASFKSMTSNVNYTTHTAVIDEDTKESGAIVLKKVGPKQTMARIDFTQPDRKTILLEPKRVQIYKPKTKTIEVYEFGNKGELVYRVLMIGFGLSGTEIAHDYDMKVAGQDTIAGKPALRLELIPKIADIKDNIPKIELWIPDSGDPYPYQGKYYLKPVGDYRTAVYTDLRINPPVRDDALKLKAPAGVKSIYPQK